MNQQLEAALIKLEETAATCLSALEQEREKRIAITSQIEQTQQELESLLHGEERMIRDMIDVELEKPISIGRRFQDKLIKKISVARFRHTERTYAVDELTEQVMHLRHEYFMLEKQMQRSQAQVQDFGNVLNNRQAEYLDLQFQQAQRSKELKEVQEEVMEMKELLQKVKEVQFTLNKVIGNQSKTTSAYSIQREQPQENFWYTLPPTPPLKLPKIK